jgi:parallel beta-helix repeat protein
VVTRMHVHDNIGQSSAGDGIAIFASDGNRVHKNRVVHNGPASGIALLGEENGEGSAGSSFNQISDNVVMDNNLPELDRETGAPSWKRDVGIAVEGPGATRNLILRNIVTGSGLHGINVFPTCSTGYDIFTGCPGTVSNDYNVIRGNVANGNGFGEPLADAPIGDGIQILAKGPRPVHMPGHNIIKGNTANGNMRNGITLGGGNGQELTGATWTTGGESYGCFRMQDGDPDDPIVDSPDLCGTNGNSVSHNTASDNGSMGIYIGPRSDGNTVSHNRAERNGMDGIGLGLAVRYDEDQNPVRDASGSLVFIDGSAGRGNVLTHNRASGNGRWDGSDPVPECAGNTWRHNRLVTRSQACIG